MKKKFINILKGTFLVGEDAFKNWRVIVFALFLGMVMVLSAHSVDSKVYEIAALSDEIKELKSAFFDGRSRLMRLKMESFIIKKVQDKGILPSDTPPQKIIIETTKQDKE